MIMGLHHASCTVSDLGRSIRFYRDVLGLKLLHTFEHQTRGTGIEGARLKIAFFQVGETPNYRLELIEYVTPRGKPYDRRSSDIGMHVCFRVADIYKVYDELVKKGVKFVTPPNETKEGPLKGLIWCYFTDPDNLTLELSQESRNNR